MAKDRSRNHRDRRQAPARPGIGPNDSRRAPRAPGTRQPSAREFRQQVRASAERRRKFRKGAFAALGVAALGAVITLAATSGSNLAGTSTNPASWVLPSLEGSGKVSLASLKGEPVVVNFFASWCTSCQAELPVFSDYAHQLRGRVRFVEVNSLETGNGSSFINNYGFGKTTIILADVGGAQSSGLHDALGGGNNMPVSAFYDSSGHLVDAHVGEYDAASLSQELSRDFGISV